MTKPIQPPTQLLFYTDASAAAFSPAIVRTLAAKGILAIQVSSLDDVRLVSAEPLPIAGDALLLAAAGAIKAGTFSSVREGFANRVCEAILKRAETTKPTDKPRASCAGEE